MKKLVIIPARGGSKGIPKKNLHELAGKPLITWSIEAALNSKLLDAIVVSSDNKEILEFSKQYEKLTCIDRLDDLAKDVSPIEPVIRYVLDELSADDIYEYLVLLQPTSPLRTNNDIDDAIRTIKDSDATSLISVIQPVLHPLKSFVKDEKGYLKGLVNIQFPSMPQQELPETYQPNVAICIVEVKEFLKNNIFFTDKTIAYIMSSNKSIDVDSLDDVKKIENQLKT